MVSKAVKDILGKELFRGEIKFNEPMSNYTSLKIGGPVDIMAFPEDPLSLKNILIAAKSDEIPVFVFGSGTNLLVRDKGMEGIAVSLKSFRNIKPLQKTSRSGFRLEPDLPEHSAKSDDSTVLFVEAGVSLGGLIRFVQKNGFSGIEALAGIPGSFGGAVYMNAGSFGTEIKDVTVSVSLMRSDGSIVNLKRDEIEFSYRCSNIPDDALILSSIIKLNKDSPENISKRTKQFLNKKRQTQPLGELSAGCIFKNPEGDSAGKLIDESGCKGMRVGDSEVSAVHANFFINKGRATCREFVDLIDTVREKVKKIGGVTLEPEIKIIGRN